MFSGLAIIIFLDTVPKLLANKMTPLWTFSLLRSIHYSNVLTNRPADEATFFWDIIVDIINRPRVIHKTKGFGGDAPSELWRGRAYWASLMAEETKEQLITFRVNHTNGAESRYECMSDNNLWSSSSIWSQTQHSGKLICSNKLTP